MIEILSSTPLATVQDLGRKGHYRDGISRSGAMDDLALMMGNALLGNEPGAAGIEIMAFPWRARISADMEIAVTGANCAPRLNGRTLPPDWAFAAREGDVLELFPPADGCRAYVCVAGGIDVPVKLDSRSTQLREGFGGFEGRMLRQGDRVAVSDMRVVLPAGGLGATPALRALPLGEMDVVTVRVIPAAEYEFFTEAAHSAFWDSLWQVTRQSNRAGYRLSGATLALEQPMELRSHGIVRGVIQVPHGGQPIIQLADAATIGGYPKIAVVIEADLWRVGQARPGSALHFVRTDYAQAVAALAARDAFVHQLAADAARQRGAAERWSA